MNLEYHEFSNENTDKLLPLYNRDNENKEMSLIIEEKENNIRNYYNFIPCHDQLGNDLFRMDFNDMKKFINYCL